MHIKVIFLFFVSTVCFGSLKSQDCLKVTCINPVDTIYAGRTIKSYFLVESTKDTATILQIKSAHGGEVPSWRKGNVIYPNHPDTVLIHSSIYKGYQGKWKKAHTLISKGCRKVFYTEWWVKPEQ